MRTFVGVRNFQDGTCRVWFGGERLHHRTASEGSHSPTGFEWGYAGSGPAELARAMCVAILRSDVSPNIYQRFKVRVVATLNHGGWTLTEEDVRGHVTAILAEVAATGPTPHLDAVYESDDV